MSVQAIQLGAHLPALQVVVPLLSAPLCVLIARPRMAWAMALVVSALALAMSAALLQQVLVSGPVSYALGGWAAPWGIEYRVDTVNAFVLLIVSTISTVALPPATTARRSRRCPAGPGPARCPSPPRRAAGA